MSAPLRLVAVASAAVSALAFAGAAAAQYTPRLTVTSTSQAVSGGGSLTLRVEQEIEDEATARITFYVPQGYLLTLPAAGAQVGTVSGEANIRAVDPQSRAPVNGVIRADNPATYAAAAARCAGPGTPVDAVWVLALTSPTGAPIAIPMYVTRVTAAPEAAFASAKMTVCLASPDDPTSQLPGAKLVTATLTLTGVLTNPAARGPYPWRAIFTPYVRGTTTANLAGTVEARSIVRLPARLNLSVRITSPRKRTVVLTGGLTEALSGVPGVTVEVQRAGVIRRVGAYALRTFGRTRTRPDGSFRAQIRFKRRGMHVFRVRARVPTRNVTATQCAPPSPAPRGCVSATIAGYTIQSAIVGPIRLR